MNKQFKNVIILLLLFVVGYMVGRSMKEDNYTFNDRLIAFYKESCIALPGQTSIMKWKDDKPMCERSRYLKHGDNLKDWRK